MEEKTMKKRLAMIMCALTLTFGMTSNVMAEVSPTGTPDNTPSDKEEEAPKTGESNLLIYGAAAALLLSGTAVISRKRLEALNE